MNTNASSISIDIVTEGRSAVQTLEKIADALGQLVPAIEKVTSASKSASNAVINMKRPLREATDAVKAQTNAFSKLGASIKRVAFYRMIRSALKAVTQGIREGINNLVLYSVALNNIDSARASGTMNEFATTALYLKNSLGAALMPLLNSIIPIVEAIANAFVTATNAVNQFFHALRGESVFTKAKKYAVDFADGLDKAGGAAKELKKQIFGFDELNIFNSPNAGGGGGGDALDYSKMFEEAELSAAFQRLQDIVAQNLGEDFVARFKLNFNEITTGWTGLNKEQVAKKIITGFKTFIAGAAGFALAGPVGALVGSLLGLTLGVHFSTVKFNGDGKLSEDELKAMLKDVLNTLCGAAIGFAVGGAGGALLGATITMAMTGLVTTFSPEAGTFLEKAELAEQLRAVATAIVGGMIGFAAGGPNGALIGMTAGASLSALVTWFAPEAGTVLTEAAFLALLLQTMKAIVAAKKMKMLLGTAAGSEAAFALIALTAVTLNVVSLLSSKGFDTTEKKIAAGIVEVLNLAMGASAGAALLGFAIGGVGGALVGVTIAAGLNLLINKVNWDWTPQSKRELELMNARVDLQAAANYLGSPQSSQTKVKQSILKGEADGGYVPAGTYFYAGEAGPELIGQVGSRTNVTNQDQFTAGMWDVMDATNTVILQAAQALIQAVRDIPATTVTIGDRDIVNAYDRGKSLAGGSLVV